MTISKHLKSPALEMRKTTHIETFLIQIHSKNEDKKQFVNIFAHKSTKQPADKAKMGG